jgi:hypothetical protein
MGAFCLWRTTVCLVRSTLHTEFYKIIRCFCTINYILTNLCFSHFKPQSFSINGVRDHL